MRKILLLLLLFVSVAFSAIDECKTDVYFGNGILTNEGNATANATLLRNAIIDMYGTLPEMKKHIGKVEEAYNHTDGMLADLLESFVQKTDGTGIEYLNRY